MRAVEMDVQTGARMELERAPILDHPDAGKRRIELPDNGFGTSLQHVPKCSLPSQCATDLRSHGDLSRVGAPIASAC